MSTHFQRPCPVKRTIAFFLSCCFGLIKLKFQMNAYQRFRLIWTSFEIEQTWVTLSLSEPWHKNCDRNSSIGHVGQTKQVSRQNCWAFDRMTCSVSIFRNRLQTFTTNLAVKVWSTALLHLNKRPGQVSSMRSCKFLRELDTTELCFPRDSIQVFGDSFPDSGT